MRPGPDSIELGIVDGRFTICKLPDTEGATMPEGPVFLCRTDTETSLVCRTESVPGNTIAKDDGWGMLRVEGTLDFSLIGILSGITSVLAGNSIGVFVVSTFDTDYILVKEDELERAVSCLSSAGYRLAEDRGQ